MYLPRPNFSMNKQYGQIEKKKEKKKKLTLKDKAKMWIFFKSFKIVEGKLEPFIIGGRREEVYSFSPHLSPFLDGTFNL